MSSLNTKTLVTLTLFHTLTHVFSAEPQEAYSFNSLGHPINLSQEIIRPNLLINSHQDNYSPEIAMGEEQNKKKRKENTGDNNPRPPKKIRISLRRNKIDIISNSIEEKFSNLDKDKDIIISDRPKKKIPTRTTKKSKDVPQRQTEIPMEEEYQKEKKRKKLTEEERKERRLQANREYMQRRRASMSEAQKEEERRKNREHMREKAKSMTESQLEERRQADRNRYANMPKEKKDKVIEKATIRDANLTKEQRENKNRHQREKYENMPQKEKDELLQQMRDQYYESKLEGEEIIKSLLAEGTKTRSGDKNPRPTKKIKK